jgi:hypothetical protein
VGLAVVSKTNRRLLIAMLLVIAVVGGAWWITLPRVDPRFFGRWSNIAGVTSARDLEKLPKGAQIEIRDYRPNGEMFSIFLGSDGVERSRDAWRWWVKNEVLYLETPSNMAGMGAPKVADLVAEKVYGIRRHSILRFQIESAKPNEITLRSIPDETGFNRFARPEVRVLKRWGH